MKENGKDPQDVLLDLIENEEDLTDWQWNFVTSCAKFPNLSSKQRKALLNVWRNVEVKKALKVAKLNRRQRKRQTGGGRHA